MSIGWFGVPGNKSPRHCNVHVVRGGRAICGTRQHRDAEYQECADESDRTIKMVECEKCRRLLSLPNGESSDGATRQKGTHAH